MDFKIQCPNCGCEYLPGELFIPNNVIGQPINIIKNEDGKIEAFRKGDQCLIAEYTCDKCNKPLKITVGLDFSAEVDTTHDMSESHKTSLYGKRINLNEDGA